MPLTNVRIFSTSAAKAVTVSSGIKAAARSAFQGSFRFPAVGAFSAS